MKRINFILVVLILGVFLLPNSAFAKKNALGLDDSVSYDIYFQGVNDSVNVISDVEIVDLTTINNVIFLTVRTPGFNLKNQDGYILFNAIKAILPNRVFRVQNEVRFESR